MKRTQDDEIRVLSVYADEDDVRQGITKIVMMQILF